MSTGTKVVRLEQNGPAGKGLSKMKLDPALVASPALTTTVDITGLLIYFGTAKLLLGI